MNSLIARTLVLLLLALTAPAKADTWQERITVNDAAPSGRDHLRTVWTGSEMIVWGGDDSTGELNTGGRYNPVANSWTAVSSTGAPSGRKGHTAVWTSTEMIVWGGVDASGHVLETGGRYDPAANSWTAVSTTGAPAARYWHTAIWTGSEMIVWGGEGSTYFSSGARYDPAGDTWTPVTTTGAPPGRRLHTALWTGTEMIVWGGGVGSDIAVNTGGRYNPAVNSWLPLNTSGAPASRQWHTAVWTGSEMIVWGGHTPGPSTVYFNTGGRYNPAGDSWTPVATSGAPASRTVHTAVWTGSEMIVWGGKDITGIHFDDGRRYNPLGNSWKAMTATGAPAGRSSHAAVWTGTEMIVWGGWNGSFFNGTASFFNDTFSYTPDCGIFRITGAVLDGGNLLVSFPSLAGRNYTLWQSESLAAGTWTNTGLPALTGTGETLTFTVPATIPGCSFFRVQADP